MRGRWGVIIAAVLVAASGLGLTGSTRAATAPVIAGRTMGQAGCHPLTYLLPGTTTNEQGLVEPTPCDEWSIDILPATPTSWSFDEERKISTSVPGGIAVQDKVHEGALVDLTLDVNGELASASITIDATAETSGGGYALVDDHPRIEFDATKTLTVKGRMVADGTGDDNASGSGAVKVELSCQVPAGSTLPSTFSGESEAFAGAGSGSPASKDVPIDVRVASEGRCSLTLTVSAGSSIAPWATGGSAGSGHARLELTISAAQAPCDLTGIVRTGDLAISGHAEPMPGVLVDLYKGTVDHNRTPDASVLTDDAGRYCVRGISPDAYALEAQLTDRSTVTLREITGDPPISKVESVAATDFNSGADRDVSFRDPADNVKDDDALLYWQAWRFIDWLLQEGVILPQELGNVSMSFDGNIPETTYDPVTGAIYIATIDSAAWDRDTPDDLCPENCEWHEISHYVADQLGIANSCASSRNHAGGENHSTCDSLSEGFAIWLPVVASLQLDAFRGAGYATADYATLDNLESNLNAPFLYEYDAVSGQLYGLEEFAVAQLLWDVMDTSFGEKGLLPFATGPASALKPAAGATTVAFHQPADEIELGAPGLVRLMATAQAKTVTDLSVLLYAASQLPQAAKDITVDFEGDGTPEVSPLDDVFLLHGFYPRRTDDFVYLVGDPIPATDVYLPTDPTTLDYARSGVPLIAGSAIELTNGGAAPITYAIDLTYPTVASHFDVAVAPGAGELVALRLPPYWRTAVDPSKGIPDCGATGHQLVTIAISGGGVASRTLDSCEFRHLVASAAGKPAISFGTGVPGSSAASPGPGGSPGASGAPGPVDGSAGGVPIIAIGAVALVVILAVVGFIVLRRRPSGA